nr:retrotransposon protein, putative, Ty1-copia subclass [Tanacetum cinerariifolium]
ENLFTSSTNNSVFRGFFEKQKLSGPNFIDWYRQLRIVLSIEDKLNYLEQPIPPAPVAPAGQQVAPEILAAHSAWQAEQELLQRQSVSSYVLKMKGYIDNLERLGHPMTLGLGYLVELIKKKKKKKKNTSSGAGGSGIFVIELNTILNRSWIYDTGCGTHICNTTQGLRASRILKPGTLSLAFEKCVSCMSGKMARKPYTHQVERAKDLLGLIHTDVCGTFKIMSRQGASYFITFTDDFSRYGYVYLLKHKHEVFETFKMFQKEVENQLEKTIKSLRSDRKGEYISQEFLDHLKDHEIIAHRTPPYTPQRNGYPKETMGYSFYYPPENKVLVARNAEFLENSLIDQEASGSLEDLEIIQEEDTHPSLDTSLYHEEGDLEIDEPQSDIVPIRRSTRTRHAPDQKLKLSKSQGASTPAEMKRMQNVSYASAVGSIMYAVRCTRLDIAFAQNITSRFQQNPGNIHWTNVKNILKYLRNTKDMFLVYGGDLKRELRVSCYTDAGYLTDADDLKSQTGYVFVLNGGAVDWKSAKQSIFATSSVEAEYIAAFDAFKEAV